MATSAMPRAIDALVALLRAAPGLAGVQVHDGSPVNDLEDLDLVVVGDGPDDLAGELQQDFNAAGARTRDENGQIVGWVESFAGDDDLPARRRRAFELLAALEEALRATGTRPSAPAMGGAVQWAHLTAGALTQSRDPKGTRARLDWRVSYRARI